jgi:hypothetical protein
MSSSIRAFSLLCWPLVSIASCGGESQSDATPASPACAGEACETPAITVRVEGDPSFLSGTVNVVVDATPPSVFHGVELSIGEAKVGNDEEPPFSFLLDTAEYPDGKVDLTAVGVVADTAERLTASLATELANHPPDLVVQSPEQDALIVGSPSKGFTLSPVCVVSDPNGVDSVSVTVEGTSFDLGACDGSVSVTLPTGTDFPHDSIELEFRATDAFGHQTARSTQVTPTNLASRFERDFGGSLPMLARVMIADDGTAVFQVGRNSSAGDGSLYVMNTLASMAAPELVIEEPAPNDAVLSGSDLYFFGSDQGDWALYHAPLDGAPKALVTLDSASYQQPSFRPWKREDGRVFAVWTEPTVSTMHLVAFDAGGVKVFDKAHPGLMPGYSSMPPISNTTALGDRIVMLAGDPQASSSTVHVFDGDTGALLDAWGLPSGNPVTDIVALEEHGVVVRTQLPAQGGPPDSALALIDPATGDFAWERPLEGTHPQWISAGSGFATVFAFASTDGAISALTRHTADGATVLWSGAPNGHEGIVGHHGSLLVLTGMTATETWQLIGLGTDGTLQWQADLALPYLDRSLVLSDGSVSAHSVTSYTDPAGSVWEMFDAEGNRVWEHSIASQSVGGVIELGELIVCAYVAADGAEQVYEARDRASGELRWRYRQGSPANLGGAISVMAWSETWGVLLGPAPTAVEESGGGTSHAAVVLGLVP